MALLSLSGTSVFLLVAGAALLVAVGADRVAELYRIPDILWLVLLGLLVGPVLGWISRSAVLVVAPLIGTAVLIIILFDAGLDLRSDVLRPLLASAVAFAVVTYVLGTLVLLVAADLFLFPHDLLLAVFFAAAVAATSGAVVIPIANRLRLGPELRGFIHLDAAIEDTLAIVFTSVLLLVVAKGGGFSTVDLALVLALPIPVGIAVGLAGGIAWLLTLSRWQDRPHAALATLGYVLAVYALASALGGSGILAALVTGIAIANAPAIHRLVPVVRPISVHSSVRAVQTDLAYMLRALFLFFLGALVVLHNPGPIPLVTIGLLSVGLLGLRYLVARSLARRHRIDFSWSSTVGAVGGRGLTSAVLLLLPLGVVAGANALFLPGVLLIIGSDVVMTLWVVLIPNAPVGRARAPPSPGAPDVPPVPDRPPLPEPVAHGDFERLDLSPSPGGSR